MNCSSDKDHVLSDDDVSDDKLTPQELLEHKKSK